MEPAIHIEDLRISLLRALMQGFQAYEQALPSKLETSDFGQYYRVVNCALGYIHDQHNATIELQIEKRMLEGENHRAEEQNQKLRDEVGRLKMEILSFAGKLREVERRDPIYIENWIESAAYENGSGPSTGTFRDARSECPTGILEAAHEDKAGVE